MPAKQLLKQPAVRGFVTLLISVLLRIIRLTARVQSIAPEATLPYMSGAQQGIFCFWHGNMIMHPFHKPKGRKMAVLISHHRDGAVITSVLGWLGIGTVRGSTRKGGANAMRGLFAACERGTNIAITPDGPRGPVYEAKNGAAMLARTTGLPLIPVAFAASRGKVFSSWDRFMLPYPFARIVFVAGAPIIANGTDAEVSETLRANLMACMERSAAEAAA